MDIDKYQYSGYGIGFDRESRFLFSEGGFNQNIIIFGVDVNSSIHVDNILILLNCLIQRLKHTLNAEKMYPINFTVIRKNILLKLALQWSK